MSVALLAGLCLPSWLAAQAPTLADALPAAAPDAGMAAPTGSFAPPRDYFLLHLVGDETDFRYVPGSLDRAANLQTRLELTARLYRKWVEVEIDPQVFVLSRDLWLENRYPEPYGLPLRVATSGLVVPASGDPQTVALWSALLDGRLPVIEGFLFRGTPDEAATMLLADVLVQRAAGAMLVDGLGFEVEHPWVRELAVHIATLAIVSKIEPGRVAVLDDLFALLGRRYDAGRRSVRDYAPDLALEDWLWFEAQFHAGARAVLAKDDPKEAVKTLRGMSKKSAGRLSIDDLLRRYDGLRDWLQERFSAVSFVP